jgi:hypothetical protein
MWADDVENNPSVINPRFDNGGRSNSIAFTGSYLPRPSWEMQGNCQEHYGCYYLFIKHVDYEKIVSVCLYCLCFD